MRFVALLMIALAAGACAGKTSTLSSGAADRRPMFEDWLAGVWESGPEAGQPLRVRVTRLPDFGHAFHVEETSPPEAEAPLRQYVWMVRPGDEGEDLVLEHWRVLDPERRAGAWKSEEKLLEFTMYTLRHTPDCDLLVRWDGTHFVVSPLSRECAECVEGAVRMQTSFVLGRESMDLRVVGTDEAGRKVFGPGAREWSWRGAGDAWRMTKESASPMP